ncbi:hypothetical protein TM102_04530 [Bradyrhizobium sp. TM102]|nr:hypothetical protein TM102_04530 [Bradyrhizobium sp. TM102]
MTITTFFPSSVVSRPNGSAVCTGAGVAAAAGGGAVGLGEALAAGEGDVVGAGDALAAGDGAGEAVADGAGEALAAGAGEADGAGEGLAEAAGAGLGVCARTSGRPSDKAAAGISAARARRRNLIIFILPKALTKALHQQDLAHQGLIRLEPGRASRFATNFRRSNTWVPNSSHDRCVMAVLLAPGGKSLAKPPRIAI